MASITATADAEGENPPAAPEGLQAAAEHDAVSLTWTASTDGTVTHYAVLRRDRGADALGVFHVIEDNAGPGTSYTDGSVSAESKYGYRVKAVSPTGVSQWSSYANVDTPAAPAPTPTPEPTPSPTPEPTPTPTPEPAEVTATADAEGENPPAAPDGLQAAAEYDAVTLTWTASTDGTVTHYAVLRRNRDTDAHGVFHVIEDNAGPGTSYTDESVSAESRYVYRVKAVSPTGVSRWSGYAAADTPAAPAQEPAADPADLAPSGLTARAVSGAGAVIAGVALAWDAPAEDAASVTGYEILRALGDGDLSTLVSDTGSADTAYTDATATRAGARYAYRVKALRGEEASQPSDRTEAFISSVTAVPVDNPLVAAQQSARPANITLAVSTDAAQDNGHPGGVWSDGTTMWVADWIDDKLYAYVLTPGDTYGDHDSAKDIDLAVSTDAAQDNGHPGGVWSDGTTMWVADWTDDKLYAYVLTSGDTFGNRVSAKEFSLYTDNGNPAGIWSDGTTIWVTDEVDDKLYAYVLTTGDTFGDRVSAKEFTLHSDNANPTGVWSDGTTMWVADTGDDELYAYVLTTGDTFGNRVSTKEFNLHTDNGSPRGMWSDGTTTWVADTGDDKLFTYPLRANIPATGMVAITGTAEVKVGDTLTASVSDVEDGNGLPDDVEYSYHWIRVNADSTDADVTSATESTYTVVEEDAGRDLKVQVSFQDSSFYTETLTSETVAVLEQDAPPLSANITLADANGSPRGVWSNGTTMWVADDGADKLFAYMLTTGDTYGNHDSDKDITLHSDNGSARGVWSDGTTVWVADDGTTRKLFAYVLATGARDSDKDLDLARSHFLSHGAWSDGTTIWVASQSPQKLFAYVLATGARDSDKDLDLARSHFLSHGAWSDGTTIWVASQSPQKLFAYVLATGARDTDKDIDLAFHEDDPTLDNASPTGVWSDGTTVWVADVVDAKLYAYVLATGARDSDKEFALGAGNSDPQGIWSDGATVWVADSDDDKLYTYPLAPNQPAEGEPAVLGAAWIGATLTADTSEITDADGIPDDVAYSYQWIRVNADSTEIDIGEATGSTYVPVAADLGLTLKVRVSFTDARGFSEEVVSAATADVQQPLLSTTFNPKQKGNHLGCTQQTDEDDDLCSARLSDDTFSYDDTDYTIDDFYIRSNGELVFEVSPPLPLMGPSPIWR